jgi:pilus assembly protein CpaF
MEPFEIQEYIKNRKLENEIDSEKSCNKLGFQELCEQIKNAFFSEWETEENTKSILDIQKKAIIGYKSETSYFKDRIDALIRRMDASDTPYPVWYKDLTDGVYQENWGLAGVSEWCTPVFAHSSSAKIIGERIYFMEEGEMVLKPQQISKNRRDQLIRAFLLLNPEERLDKVYHETYLLDGTRVTIFAEPMAKKGQDAIVFRRYIVPILSFEEQARRRTIPREAIPLFRYMVKIGFNVVFLGAVRTAKTTFLTTWQSYEDPLLEGVMVETDPEIPLHMILPKAPILQLLADGQELLRISKSLLRSDADYFILAEARDGIALNTAVKIAGKGTKRLKLTFHCGDPTQFPLEAADEIVQSTGGDIHMTMCRIAAGFDYLFHFVQLSDKREKRLKSIHEMCCDADGKIKISPVCSYDMAEDNWTFHKAIGPCQSRYAAESDPETFREMQLLLNELACASPITNRPLSGESEEDQ